MLICPRGLNSFGSDASEALRDALYKYSTTTTTTTSSELGLLPASAIGKPVLVHVQIAILYQRWLRGHGSSDKIHSVTIF